MRSFTQGEACGGAGLDRVGLLTAKESGAVVLVALRSAAGEGESERGGCVGAGRGEAVEEVEQVVGIRPGHVQTHDEGQRSLLLDEVFEALAEEGVAGSRLGERQFVDRGLKVVAEEDGVIAVA